MHIRPPQPRDFSDMATLANKALFHDPLTVWVAPHRHQHPECMRQGYLRRAKRRFYGGKYMMVAVTDQHDPDWDGVERVVGYLSANSTRRQTEQARQSWFSWNNWELAFLSLETQFVNLVGGDKALSYKNYYTFHRILATLNSTGPFAELDLHDCWDVDFLAVDPAYHRRGIGATLMEHIKTLATEERIPVTLVASSMGIHLYRKLGFTEVGEVKTDALLLGTAMVWYPEKSIEPDVKAPEGSAGISLDTLVPPNL
ncbi:hypothetical protein LTR84_000264 [Exophiala bonariae]|uniref:N-acetyltransferase domain-containing protein n=1 Tax=Exophiala bonariae TaxID=1690606 RepID=A0AAV9NQ30_9EURO|nr:hypothetical protein LTR84_000264 [Exophiala bonariae]